MEDISKDVIGAAIEVHKNLGPGLLEKYYERALKYELEQRGHKVRQQERVSVMYKGIDLAKEDDDTNALRFDLVVDNCLVIEIKSVEELKKVHFKQLRTYMKILNIPIGLLFNFNVVTLMKQGFGRIVEGYDWESDQLPCNGKDA